jgi:hypothetical protein
VANTKTSTAERRINGRIGGQKAQSVEVLAAKIVRDWPALSEHQKSTVRTMLRPVVRGSNG